MAIPRASAIGLACGVRARLAAEEQMGARMLFVAMPRAGAPAYAADREMLDIIHDGGEGGGGGYEDGQVEDSDPTQSGNYQQQQSYTQTGDGTQQQQHWATREQK